MANADKVKIGLISDAHGWLDPEFAILFKDVDHIIHAGDIGQEHVLEQLKTYAEVSVVKGNIDGGPLRFLPQEVCVKIAGRTLVVLHIAGSPKRPNKQVCALIKREQADAVIVGHSHIPVVAKVHNALWINPGAAGRQGFHNARHAAFLYIDKETGAFSLERIHLGARAARVHKDP